MVWSLNISDGLEIDEYDDERAMYAIAFDVEGKVAISGRFRPADDRSMLVDHFAHVLPADIGPINNATTWEVSRACSIEYGQRHYHLQRKAARILTTFDEPLAHVAQTKSVV